MGSPRLEVPIKGVYFSKPSSLNQIKLVVKLPHEKDSILMPENKEEGMIGGKVCWLFHLERHRYSFHQSSGSSFCTLFVNLENRMESTFFLIKLNETRSPAFPGVHFQNQG